MDQYGAMNFIFTFSFNPHDNFFPPVRYYYPHFSEKLVASANLSSLLKL